MKTENESEKLNTITEWIFQFQAHKKAMEKDPSEKNRRRLIHTVEKLTDACRNYTQDW